MTTEAMQGHPTRAMKMVTATVAGHRYEIPEMWLLGASAGGMRLEQALRYWHEQELAQLAFNAD